jgi:hypothetical protein
MRRAGAKNALAPAKVKLAQRQRPNCARNSALADSRSFSVCLEGFLQLD